MDLNQLHSGHVVAQVLQMHSRQLLVVFNQQAPPPEWIILPTSANN